MGNRLLLPRLIGKRWAANGRGPSQFDRWHLWCATSSGSYFGESCQASTFRLSAWGCMLQTIFSRIQSGGYGAEAELNGVIVAGARRSRSDGPGSARRTHWGVVAAGAGRHSLRPDLGCYVRGRSDVAWAGWRNLMFYEPKSARAI